MGFFDEQHESAVGSDLDEQHELVDCFGLDEQHEPSAGLGVDEQHEPVSRFSILATAADASSGLVIESPMALGSSMESAAES